MNSPKDPREVAAARQRNLEQMLNKQKSDGEGLPPVNADSEESVGEINPATGRPFPKINPALQKQIQATIEQAQNIKPLTTEIVEPEGPSVPIADAPYTPRKDVDTAIAELPSRYAFYDFKELYVGKFRVPHFAKLHESYVTKSYAYLLEAVSDVLSTSHPAYQDKPLAFYLTVPDFYWVLYFLRLNQIKTHLTHRTRCQGIEHNLQVKRGEKAPETLDIVHNVTRSQINTKYLGAAPDMSKYEFDTFRCRVPLMLDVMEAMAHPEATGSVDFMYLCRVASLIQIKDDPDASLAKRLKFIETLEFDDLNAVSQFEKDATRYGPEEFVQVTCTECGHQQRSKVSLDARSFLPLQ